MIKALSDLLVRIGAIGIVAMTAIIGWQVFGRFILAKSPSWTEQAALLLMIWYVLFAAAAGVREGFHIRIPLAEGMAPRHAATIRKLIDVLIIGFGLVLLVYGAQLVWSVRAHVIPSLGLSRAVAYLPLPVSGLLMTVFAIARLARGEKDDVHDSLEES